MSKALRFQASPRSWDRLSFGGDAMLRLGSKHIRLADVTSVERIDHAERDFQGVLLMGCVFSTASAIFFVGVYEYGMRERFLLGSFIFLVLGLISLYEAATSTTFRFVQLRISLAHGENLYTTADAADAAALELVLAKRA